MIRGIVAILLIIINDFKMPIIVSFPRILRKMASQDRSNYRNLIIG